MELKASTTGPAPKSLSSIGLALRLAEAGVFPDLVLRAGTRHLLRRRLRESVSGSVEAREREQTALMDRLAGGPIAIDVAAANEQHYEVPAPFFELVLGPRLKYSCCHWDSRTPNLAAAENAMLELTARRARIEDGMRILDLGCGWGSFTLWAAEKFPNSQILAVSNSHIQRAFIEGRATERALTNVRVETTDINDFQADEPFDRVVSIEMMEHVRNHRALFERIAAWLTGDGLAFSHIFCHRSHAYTYEHRDPSDWMAKNFFTGGMMPSEGMFQRYQDDLVMREQWRVNGRHYHRTCDAWLERLDQNRDAALRVLADGYGSDALRWLYRWRLFFIACSELFAYRDGEEWFVSHYLWEKR
jgi:cyclopropane-fatty-acyl-phospholipid synthase